MSPFSRAAAALAIIALLSGCSDEDGAAKAGGAPTDAVNVAVVTAAKQPVQRTVDVVGTLWGEEDVAISNKVPGKVIAVYKDEGDRIEPGAPLAQLLRNDYELAVNQKTSALQEVLAKLGVAELPPADFDATDLPAVRSARLQAENARGRLERGRQLHEQVPPLMSDQDFADLRTTYEVARSAHDVALLTARSLVAESRTKQAELRIAEQALADTTIRAPRPVGGTSDNPASRPAASTSPSAAPAGRAEAFAVAERRIEVGELLPQLTPMFRLVDDDPLKLKAAVPERFVPDVRPGQHVDVTVESYPDRPFGGRVSRVRPQIDPANRTFQVEIVVPNPDRLLRAGAFARAKVATRQEEAVFVPSGAIATFAGVSKVFTVKDGKAQEIRVELGRTTATDERVEVTKGLKGGEPVIARGTAKLATGVPVVVDGAPAAIGKGAEAPATHPAASAAP
jgi:multidrug efflux pump subunit AcrA (membrane-fusion protein)